VKPDSPTERYVTGPYIQMLLDQCSEHKVSCSLLTSFAGLPHCILEPRPERLLTRDYTLLLAAGEELCNDPLFGLHAGQKTRPSSFPILGYTLMSCRTLGQSLEQVLHYESLVHDLGYSEFKQEGDIAYYSWSAYDEETPGYKHLADCVFSGILVIAQWLTESKITPLAVELRRSASGYEDEYKHVADCNVTFDQPQNRFLFCSSILDLPVKQADPALFPMLKQHADKMLQVKRDEQQSGQQGTLVLSDNVKRLLQEALPHQKAQLPAVADTLGITPRSLQRKLKEEGNSFQQLLDEARKSLAMDLFNQPGLSMTEISHMLGYREQSSFNHAFKNWTGLTPTAWRQQNKNKA